MFHTLETYTPKFSTVNNCTYTRLYAWHPVRTSKGNWLLFEHYYIRYTQHRLTASRLLCDSEYIMDLLQGK